MTTDGRGDETQRRAVRVLAMVGELHKRGYQRLRIAPHMSDSGGYWRCLVTDVSNIRRDNGVMVARDEDRLVARHTTGNENRYFGWEDRQHATARELADTFIERFADIAAAGRGDDWAYAGWFVRILGIAETGWFPAAFSNSGYTTGDGPMHFWPYGGATDHPELPMPPPGSGSG